MILNKEVSVDQETTVLELKKKVRQFVEERDWQQFHTGKNLSMSIAIEAAELMEHFQWEDIKSAEGLPEDLSLKVQQELADIVIYALDFCNSFGLDLSEAIEAKLRHNAEKYPVEQAKGKSHKYTFYQKNKETL